MITPYLPDPYFPPAAPYTWDEALAFWKHVHRKRGCWPWIGLRTDEGEPYYLFRDTCVPRRAAWELFYGPVPGTIRVIPRCGNLDCVHPDHLGLASARVRILPYGSGYAPPRRWAGLAPADVLALRRAARHPHNTYRSMAADQACDMSTVQRAVRGRRWRRAAWRRV
jgi:hypothetical protein